MDATATPAKLPVLPTLVGSWRSVAQNIGSALRLYGPWVAITTVCLLAWGVGIVVNGGFSQPSPALLTGAGAVPGLVLVLALLLASPAIFVAWHKVIYTGTRPDRAIRIDGTVWAYIGYSLLIALLLALSLGLVLLLATVVAGITTGLGDGPMSLERLAALRPFLPLAIIPYYLLLSRFSLVLPAIAVGRPMSLADSIRKTRGNTWRLTVGAGLVYLPVIVLSGILEVTMVALPDQTAVLGLLSLAVLGTSIYCLHAALSFGTLALKTLAPEPMMADAEAA